MVWTRRWTKLQVSNGANARQLWPREDAAAAVVKMTRVYQVTVDGANATNLRRTVKLLRLHPVDNLSILQFSMGRKKRWLPYVS